MTAERDRSVSRARAGGWPLACPEGHASIEVFVTTFRCRACGCSYPKSELVRVDTGNDDSGVSLGHVDDGLDMTAALEAIHEQRRDDGAATDGGGAA